MTTGDLLVLLDSLRKLGAEIGAVEVKRAETELPARLWETLSAFANTPGGGVLLLGVREDGFIPVGVKDPGKIQADLAALCRQMEPALRPLITVYSLAGASVVCAEVPEADFRQKPCYYRGAGLLGGTFVRVANTNRRATQYEVQLFLDGRGQPAYDAEPVPEAGMDELDEGLLAEFLARLRRKPGAVYRDWRDEEILRAFRVITDQPGSAQDRPSVAAGGWGSAAAGRAPSRQAVLPTLAGYLCFGGYPQERFPALRVDVVTYPTPRAGEPGVAGERLLDSVKVEGPLGRMVVGALEAIERNLPHRAVVEGPGRVDEPLYPAAVLREAVVNALGHRDYSPLARGSAVQVRIFPDRLEVENPGGLFGPVTVDRLGEAGVQASRNGFLMKVLEDLPLPGGLGVASENRGTGIVAMVAALRRVGMAPPIFDDRRTTFRVTLLRYFPVGVSRADPAARVPVSDLPGWPGTGRVGRRTPRGDEREYIPRRIRGDRREEILHMLRDQGPLSCEDIARRLGLTEAAVHRWLRILRQEGRVAPTTARVKSPHTRYTATAPDDS
ncbi:MAG: ATP-binding protein [Bacillota bacterium]|nr:ATP-binding protein [Bacillota bacterium]